MPQRTIRAIPPVPDELPWATARFLGAVKENLETLYGLRGEPAGLAELLGLATINNTTVVGGTTTWGNIGGVLSNQTDLQAELDAKATVAALALKADLAGATFTGAVSIQSTLGVTGAITHGAGNQVLDSTGSQSSLSGGLTLSGILNAIASGTGAASLNVPHGVAPTTPTDGDFWSTTAGFFGQVNGATVGPFAAAGGGGGKVVLLYNQPVSASPTAIDIGWDETLYKEIVVILEGVQCATNAVTLQCSVGESDGTVMHETTGDYQGTEHEWTGTTFGAAARSDCIRVARNTSNVAGATISGSIRIMGLGGQKGCTIWACVNYVLNGGTSINAMDSRGFVDDSAPAGVIDTFRLFFGIPATKQAFANVGTIRAYGLLG